MSIQPSRLSWKALAVVGIIAFIIIQLVSTVSQPDAVNESNDGVPGLTRQQAAEKALEWARSQDPQAELRAEAVLDTHKLWAGYIARNDYTAVYERDFAAVYPTDYYLVDLYDQTGAIQYVLELHPETGNIYSWRTPAAKGGGPRSESERVAAEELRRLGIDSSEYTLLSDGKGMYNVVYQHQKDRLGQASRQIVLSIRGDKVLAYEERFEVPSSHTSWQEQQDDKADRMGLSALALSLGMGVIAIVYSIRSRSFVSFKRGLVFTLAYLVLNGITMMNTFPAMRLELTGIGDIPDRAILGGLAIFRGIELIITGVILYFSFVSGEGMMRSERLSLWPNRNDPHTGDYIFASMKLGYLVCCFLLGIQAVLFFIAEHQFDSWAINNTSMSVFNMKWPFLFPLLAWVAAISEETIYRLFGVLLFKKMLRNNFLAVLFPSMIWALGHTAYPIYPSYTRFFEVTILGIIFGYVFLRHGFYTVVFAHAAMNSILMGLTLLFSMQDGLNIIAGVIAIISPVLVALALRRFNRHRESTA
jgi:hypothetical protein